MEPAARKLLQNPAGWCGGGFPAHEKCPAQVGVPANRMVCGERSNPGAVSLCRKAQAMSGGHCDDRAGHFRVRLSGRYNVLYLAAPWGLQGVRPGTPRDPVLRLRLRWKRALIAPQPAPLCRRFCRLSLGGRGVPLLGGKNAPAGGRGTKDGGYCRDENSACDSSQTLLK